MVERTPSSTIGQHGERLWQGAWCVRATALLWPALCLLALAIALNPPRSHPPPATGEGGATPQRIVSYVPAVEALATIDDQATHVAAAPGYLRDSVRLHPISRVFPPLGEIASTGMLPVPDPEEVMKRNADAVVVNPGLAGNLVEIGHPRILSLPPTAGDMGSVHSAWRMLGRRLDASERVEKLLAAHAAAMAAIGPPSGGVLPPRVLVLIAISGQWRIGGRGLYLNPLLRQLGAENVAAALPLNAVSDLEQLFILDPDVILILDGIGAPAPANLFADPAWRTLKAVRERRIYVMPARATFNAPVDEPLFARWLWDILYPGRGPERTRAAYAQAYRNIYGYRLSTEDLNAALRVDANAASAGYERFRPPVHQ